MPKVPLHICVTMPLSLNIASHKSEVAAVIRERDWSTFCLGVPSTWPVALRATVRLMLDSGFPMCLAWGPNLNFFYNDAYAEFLGDKHPHALGRPLPEIWGEIWTDIRPLVERAMAGEPVYLEDLPLVIRRNGQNVQTWFTFSYSPLYNDSHEAVGMHCVCHETSRRVLVEHRQSFQLEMATTLQGLTAPADILAAASRLIGQHFCVARVGYGDVDPQGSTVAVHQDWTSGTVSSLAGESRPLDSFGPAIIHALKQGQTLQLDDIAKDERSAPYAAGYASIGAQSMIIVPLLDAGQLTAVLYLHEPAPRRWNKEEVALAEEVARRTWEAVKRARAEEALQARERELSRIYAESQSAAAALRDESRVLELLNQAGTTIASTLDLQTLLQSVTDAATQLSGAKFGAFFYNTTGVQGDALGLFTLSGAPREAFEKLGHPRSTPLFTPTFHGDALVRSDDITQDSRYAKAGAGMPTGHLPVRSYLAVPVVSRAGHPIGGLLFGHPEPGVFSARTERLIRGVAAQASIAVDNARLYEAAQKAAEEREALLTRERTARSEAERLSRMKDEFLAMLAHELRNPLAPISSASELLNMMYADDERVQRTSAVIKRQVTHMTRLVDDLLDVSRVTRGLVTLHNKIIDIRQAVSGAVDQVRPLMEAKQHTLVLDLPQEAVRVNGDPTRLIQAIANILNNAVKYTPASGLLELRVRVDGAMVCLSVRDNGSGMPGELVPEVFDLFTQGTRTLARSQGGLGLGLALVKKLVELHHGEVAAYSAGVGQGSEFTIRLPLWREPVNTPAPATDAEAVRFATPSARRSLCVLVIDDNIDAADTLAMALTVIGHRVCRVYSAQSALERVALEAPDVFLVDIGLPDMDGYELAGRLRALPHAKDATLIAVTGYGQEQDRERSAAAGFAHHLVKPVDVSKLVTLLADIKPNHQDVRQDA